MYLAGSERCRILYEGNTYSVLSNIPDAILQGIPEPTYDPSLRHFMVFVSSKVESITHGVPSDFESGH